MKNQNKKKNKTKLEEDRTFWRWFATMHILVHYIVKCFYLTTTYPNCNATLCGGLKYISESTRVY